MAEYTLKTALPDGIPLPAFEEAMSRAIPGAIIATWQDLLAAHVDTGQALASLVSSEALQYPYRGDRHAVGVVSFDPSVHFLEVGRAGFHLAERWGSRGGRWKISAKGKLYAHVPFRVHTPPKDSKGMLSGGASSLRRRAGSSMTETAYRGGAGHRRALSLGDYSTTRDRLTGLGDLYKQSKAYDYYRAIYGADAEIPDVQGYTWAASQLEGLMRNIQFNPETGATSSEYFTIRTITPDSDGWWIPPTEAHHYSDLAVQRAAAVIDEIADRALAQDMEAAVLGATEGL